MEQLTRIERFAKDYAEAAWKSTCYKVAYKSYISGYNQCIDDAHEVDMDEWQKRLSDSYSFLKEKHYLLKTMLNEEKEKVRKLSNPTHEEKLNTYIKLKREFEEKEIYY